jgi:hypothetical protein
MDFAFASVDERNDRKPLAWKALEHGFHELFASMSFGARKSIVPQAARKG